MTPDDNIRPRNLLLHACCGPCLLEPLDALASEAEHVTVVFANPNIHPAEEYRRRRNTLVGYAHEVGVDVVELPYDRAAWDESVAPLAEQGTIRCEACYRLRLGMAAEYAAAHGYEALATTLSVSPYQNHEAIRREGRLAAAAADVAWIDRDFRERYPEATRRSRELGMYRQNYCGCVFSQAEAQQGREARREARRAEKAARRTGSER
jgi:predicted adenine nucleotide alpha hydrolase (AANH) superfamily ATPase